MNNNKNDNSDLKTCSKNCCNLSQWPVPFIENKNTNFVPNNFSCNFQDGSGCACLTENDINNLSNKYNNL